MKTEHRIYTEHVHDRWYWECSCGRSGSSSAHRVDLASDRHIPEDEMRVDTNRPLDGRP
jgi:hypothetical protein